MSKTLQVIIAKHQYQGVAKLTVAAYKALIEKDGAAVRIAIQSGVFA